MFYVAILLHGICYDFFFMTGQLYTDQEAPANLRSVAQGINYIHDVGLGMSWALISGRTVDYFSRTVGTVVTRNWQNFWISSACSAFVVLCSLPLLP